MANWNKRPLLKVLQCSTSTYDLKADFYTKPRLCWNRIKELIFSAFSRDFSSKGLQLECAEPVSFSKGDTLKISLPELQKITTKHQLSGLAYEVMAVSKNKLIMNMRVIDPTNDHPGKIFFQQLINNNRSKLTMAEETPKFPGLGPALRNMYVKALDTFAFYVHRQGVRYNLDVVAVGAKPNALHKLLAQFSEDAHSITMLPLLKNNATNLHFANQLKKIEAPGSPIQLRGIFTFLSQGKTA